MKYLGEIEKMDVVAGLRFDSYQIKFDEQVAGEMVGKLPCFIYDETMPGVIVVGESEDIFQALTGRALCDRDKDEDLAFCWDGKLKGLAMAGEAGMVAVGKSSFQVVVGEMVESSGGVAVRKCDVAWGEGTIRIHYCTCHARESKLVFGWMASF